jgi:predicted Zn-dependent protease
VSYSTDTPELVKQLAEEGVEFWESFGYTIGNVTIRVADARTSSTRVHWHANGCIGKATITIAAKHLQLSPETLQRVIAHELGHSLGLDHVAGDMFPMSPVIR